MSRRHCRSRSVSHRESVQALESRRLLAAAGSLDTSFNGTGKATLDFTSTCVALTTDGKAVVAGYVSTGAFTSNTVVARFNVDGTRDTTFGPNGTGEIVNDLGEEGFVPGAIGVQ